MTEMVSKALSVEGFAKYGRYADMTAPSGPTIGEEPVVFYRDMAQCCLGTATAGSFSVCRVMKRPLVIDVSEYHDHCCETLLPLDGDILLHVAPACADKEFPADHAEIFLVPRGTLVVLRPGVWHHAPFAVGSDCVNCLVMLPERTYMNDCVVYPIPEERRIRVRSASAR
jgi:ureidoglycolate lyase